MYDDIFLRKVFLLKRNKEKRRGDADGCYNTTLRKTEMQMHYKSPHICIIIDTRQLVKLERHSNNSKVGQA